MTRLSAVRWLGTMGLAMTLVAGASGVWAAGFALSEQSPAGLGNAFAGGAAKAEDPSTIFWNPAGMVRLPGQQVVVGAHTIITSYDWNDKDTKTANPTVPSGENDPAFGSTSTDGGVTSVVPNAYYTYNPGGDWVLGLGVNVPFGLSTEYDEDWVGRYHATTSAIMTVNINPSLAYKFDEKLSFGFGLNVQYVDAELSNKIDFGLLSQASSPGLLEPGNPAYDVDAELTGDNWGYGFNVGLLYQFTEDTRVGFGYRSTVRHEVSGEGKFKVPDILTAIDPNIKDVLFADRDADLDVTLPASASLSAYHKYNQKFALMADVTWTNWSQLEELRVIFEPVPGSPLTESVTTLDWKNSWRFALGADYHLTPAATLRCGISYETTPVRSKELRTPRVPDNDRWWFAVGGGYRVNDWVGFDAGYTYILADNPEIDKSGYLTNPEEFSRGGLVGEFDATVHIVSAQANFYF